MSDVLPPAHMHKYTQFSIFSKLIQDPGCCRGILQHDWNQKNNRWIVPKQFSKCCLITPKYQFTKITDFNCITDFKNNTHLGSAARGSGMCISSWSSRFHWHIKQLLSSSKNFREYFLFTWWLLTIFLCLRAYIIYLISYSISKFFCGSLKGNRNKTGPAWCDNLPGLGWSWNQGRRTWSLLTCTESFPERFLPPLLNN